MRLLLIVLALTLPALAQQDDPIRDARAASNRAIDARDLPAYAATITPDFTITTGSGLAYTHDTFLYLWKNLFADPLWLGCLRTPDRIDLSPIAPLAAEHGHFVCRSRQPDGVEVYTGTYLAQWHREDRTWKTRSELFVTLACTGSEHCKPHQP